MRFSGARSKARNEGEDTVYEHATELCSFIFFHVTIRSPHNLIEWQIRILCIQTRLFFFCVSVRLANKPCLRGSAVEVVAITVPSL